MRREHVFYPRLLQRELFVVRQVLDLHGYATAHPYAKWTGMDALTHVR